MSTMLYKWWAASLTQYRLILFSDLDVQLLRPEQPLSRIAQRWRETWQLVVPAHGRTQIDVGKDAMSPVNSGIWTLAWPRRGIYERGLAVLERANWNATHGFDLVGRPKQIYARADGALRARMFNTWMLKRDSWSVNFGDCDQGFIFYMFFLHEPGIGAEEEAVSRSCMNELPHGAGCAHTARHHQGPRKPWQLEKDNRGRVQSFLRSFNFSHLVNVSRCASRLEAWRVGLAGSNAARRAPGAASVTHDGGLSLRMPAGGSIQRVR